MNNDPQQARGGRTPTGQGGAGGAVFSGAQTLPPCRTAAPSKTAAPAGKTAAAARGAALTPAQAEAAARLGGYRQSAWRAERLAEELQAVRALGQRVTPLLTGMPGAGPDRDQVARTVERMEHCARRLQQQARRCMDEQKALAGLLEQVSDERLRLLLWLRYARGLGWEPISERLGITERWARKLHLRALDQLAGQQGAAAAQPSAAAAKQPPKEKAE